MARALDTFAGVAEPRDARGEGQHLPGPAEGPELGERGFQVREVGGALVLLRHAPSGPESMMQALISGRVAVLDGGCIGLADGGEPHLVAWPSATTFAPDGVAIQVPGVGVFRVGDLFQGGGGYGYSANMDLPAEIASCATHEVAVLNEVQWENGQPRADRRQRRRA